ncbi:uncharacterized protein LOC141632132 [Silene latifolia]|uniref:uncharacterized protein LOC141632132 n=1 Tax=Silene latifolia TaxID=37657 RepID=UPI003D788BC9
MPFGLKNAGSTYQRLVNRMFKEEIGRIMEVYIDDMVVKSEKAEQHMSHLENTFSILRKYHIKLNLLKCTFRVSSGKFLGYLVTQRGIEASTEQIKEVLQLESPQKPKDVQRLTGWVAALHRFISRSSDRCRLFYGILRKSQKFEWTPEHEKAFGELKQYLSTPSLLSKSEQGEPLYLYLSVTEVAVSAVLVREHVECPARRQQGCNHLVDIEAGILCTATPYEETDDWRKPYISWLRDEVLPPNQKDARSFKMQSSRFVLIDGILYRKSLAGAYLRTEDYCARWNIKLFKSTPRNPQSNGQAESNNKIVMNNLKRRLEEIGANWADELPFVQWSDRTTPKVATGQTPFSLVYGAEAVIPSKVQMPTHRYANGTEERNQVKMASSLDTIDELRTSAKIRMAAYKQTAARSYNKNVRLRTLQVGDLVLRKVFPNTKNQSEGIFAYNWEGPYRIEGIVGNGAYKLETMDGEAVPRSWNIIHLKKYYI